LRGVDRGPRTELFQEPFTDVPKLRAGILRVPRLPAEAPRPNGEPTNGDQQMRAFINDPPLVGGGCPASQLEKCCSLATSYWLGWKPPPPDRWGGGGVRPKKDPRDQPQTYPPLDRNSDTQQLVILTVYLKTVWSHQISRNDSSETKKSGHNVQPARGYANYRGHWYQTLTPHPPFD